jgi:hypothetical protein
LKHPEVQRKITVARCCVFIKSKNDRTTGAIHKHTADNPKEGVFRKEQDGVGVG